MKRQSRIALISVAVLLVLASWLATLGKPALRLTVAPQADGKVDITLRNSGQSVVEFYDSLSGVPDRVPPSLTSIRLRDGSGRVMTPTLTAPEGWWYPDYSLVRRVPVILDALPPGGAAHTTTALTTLLYGYPDDAWLVKATEAQIRCAVYLKEGVVETRTDWFPLPAAALGKPGAQRP